MYALCTEREHKERNTQENRGGTRNTEYVCVKKLTRKIDELEKKKEKNHLL